MRRLLAALLVLPCAVGAQESSQTHNKTSTPARFDRKFPSAFFACSASPSCQSEATELAERIISIPYVPLGLAPEDYIASKKAPPIYDFDPFFEDYFDIGAKDSSAIYSPETGKIVIRNTLRNIDLIQYYLESNFPITQARSEALGWLEATKGKSSAELADRLKASRQTFDPILKGYILELEKMEDLRKRIVRRGNPDPDELAILNRRIASLNKSLAEEFAPLRTRLQAQLRTSIETENYLRANRIVGIRPAPESLLKEFRPAKPTALATPFTGTLRRTDSTPPTPLNFNFLHPASVGTDHFPREAPHLTHSQDSGESFSGNPYQLRKVLPSIERIKSLESYEALIKLLGKPTIPAIFADRDDTLDPENDYWLFFQPSTKSSIRVLQVGVTRKIHEVGNAKTTRIETVLVRDAILTNKTP